jgi:microcystin synthetase protein McyC
MNNLQQSNSIDSLTKQQYYEVSHGQRRLWVLQHIDENSTAYNIRLAFTIKGDLNIRVFTKIFEELVNRHEILRTTFSNVAGNIQQVIHPEIPPQKLVIVKDFSDEQEAEILADNLIQEAANSPFNLEKLPLLRILLVRIQSDEFICGLTLHHIIGDARSLDILFEEFCQLYQANIQEKQAILPTLSLQYKDYTARQNQWLASGAVKEQETYWREVFAEQPPLLNLPTDFPRPQFKASQAVSYTYHLSGGLSEQLKTLATKNQTTLFITLLTLFKILIYRYTEQPDLVIGIPISSRNHPELENQIGFYVNTLALRTLLPETGNFQEVLREVTNTCLDAYEYGDYPFDKLVSTLDLERDLLRNPLFDVMFSLLSKDSKTELEIPGLKFEDYPLQPRMAQFDLGWSFFDNGKQLYLGIEYEPKLFRPETITRMLDHFLEIVQSVLAQPDCLLSKINLLTPAERHQLLVEWNDTAVDYPQHQCLHHLVEEQVLKTPEEIAVIFEGQELTYQALNERANQLAHYLQEKGVKPEVLVGIYLERSLEAIIGILAILKAGGAYVPLDPTYPRDRLDYMLTDSAVSILLTQQSLVTQVTNLREDLGALKIESFCLDSDWLLLEHYSRKNPSSSVQSENLAYLIYTSGSTGKPKGVMNLHQGICNNILRTKDSYPTTNRDRLLQISSLAFDASVWDIFWSLSSGMTLIIPKPEGTKDPAYLIQLMREKKVSQVAFVPSLLRLLLLQPNLENCRYLKRVFCGGEALSYELIQQFFQHFNCELHNLYGPTETSVDAALWQCPPQTDDPVISIGRPIANTQIYILDRHLQPVPVGIVGELHIGGIQLARGYLNQLELTAEKFIPNPFAGGRLYKTGDLVRYLADGNIEYLGRIDNQVKLRGLRIELGEIQTILDSHPQINQSVVIIQTDSGDNQRLVAYVASQNQALTAKELRQFLQPKLPAYMIPSAFVILPEFPLNPNGKVDLKKLPQPDETALVESVYVAPRNDTDQILVNLWQQLFQVTKIGINDNFFELGGHSLQAMNLMALIYQDTEVEIPLSVIYEKPTVAELSDYIIYAQEMNIQPKERPYVVFNATQKQAIFLFPPALGFAAAYANLADYLTDHIIYTFRYISDELMLEQYAELIDRLAPNQEIKLMGHSAGGFLAMLMAQQLELRDRVVSDVILLDTYRGGREAKKAEMSEVQEGVDGFLLNPKRKELRRYFMENQKLRDRTYQQVWEYFNFLWNSDLKNIQIKGTIHLIRAEENHETEDDWTQATTGQRINHYASGIHREMIDPPYVQQNATIVDQILSPIQI